MGVCYDWLTFAARRGEVSSFYFILWLYCALFIYYPVWCWAAVVVAVPSCLLILSSGWTLTGCCSVFVFCFAFLRFLLVHVSFRSSFLSVFVALPPSVSILSLCRSTSGLTPALACAPSREVADCLALILATMMPFCSPCSSGAPSPGSLLRHIPHQGGKGLSTGPRASRSPRNPSGPSSEGTTENDSEDSETFWPLWTDSLASYLEECTWTSYLSPRRGMMQCLSAQLREKDRDLVIHRAHKSSILNK